MKGLLTDLMLEASSPHCQVANLLWRTHRVAEQVSDGKLQDWSAQELRGFGEGSAPPAYRILQARLWVRTPPGEWKPFERVISVEQYCNVSVLQNAGALTELLASSGVRIAFPFSPAEIEELRALEGDPRAEFIRYVSRGKLEGILRHIRHTVREWAFNRIEPDGVLPEKVMYRKAPSLWALIFGTKPNYSPTRRLEER
jgi:AbiTii